MGEHTLKFGAQLRPAGSQPHGHQRLPRPLLFREPVSCTRIGRCTRLRLRDARSRSRPINTQPDATLNAKDTAGRPVHPGRVEARRSLDGQRGHALGLRVQRQQQQLCHAGRRRRLRLRNYPGWAARGIDPEDYISDGSNREAVLGRVPAQAWASPTTFTATAISSSSAARAAITIASCSSRARSRR